MTDWREQLTAREQLVRELNATSRGELIAMAKALAPSRGDQWLIGGPDEWGRDELISYIAGPRA